MFKQVKLLGKVPALLSIHKKYFFFKESGGGTVLPCSASFEYRDDNANEDMSVTLF